MKKFFTPVMMAAAILSYSQLCQAQFDDPACFSQCDTAYSSCIADVINLPEPRTYDEQHTLDACSQALGECQHSCEDTNSPSIPAPKQEDGK